MTFVKFNRPTYNKHFNYGKYADAFQKELNGRKQPLVNISEDNEYYYIQLAAPGLNKNDFAIKVEKQHLEISTNVQKADQDYKKREFNFGNFSRKFELPNTANKNEIEAKYEAGILEVKIAKKAEAKPKVITVD